MGNKKWIIGVGIFIVLLSVIGISYALWIVTVSQTTINKVSSSCLNLTLTNEKNNINLQNAYPILDSEGESLTPYSFTITNTCDLFASYTVNLEVLEDTTLPSEYLKVMVNGEEPIKLTGYETTITTITGDCLKIN